MPCVGAPHRSRQHNLRRSVPPGSDVFSHEASLATIRLSRGHRSSKAEVADFQVTVGIQQQVGRL